MGVSKEPVAIVGYSYRMPGGIRSDEDFWRLLRDRDIVQEPITDRYGRGYRPVGKSSNFDSRFASSYEGLIRDGEELLFDCRLFGLSVQEASYMDPQIKMLLTCAWETFEHVGLEPAPTAQQSHRSFCRGPDVQRRHMAADRRKHVRRSW